MVHREIPTTVQSEAKRYGSLLWTSSSPAPTVLIFLLPRFHLQGKSHLSSGESVLECFNCLGHHWGNFLHSRFPRIIRDRTAGHWSRVGTAGAGPVIGQFLRAGVEAAAAVAGRNMAASCCIWCWLNPDFLRNSCSSGSKLLLPSSDISRWFGHRIDKSHLCLSSFRLIGMCRPDVVR